MVQILKPIFTLWTVPMGNKSAEFDPNELSCRYVYICVLEILCGWQFHPLRFLSFIAPLPRNESGMFSQLHSPVIINAECKQNFTMHQGNIYYIHLPLWHALCLRQRSKTIKKNHRVSYMLTIPCVSDKAENINNPSDKCKLKLQRHKKSLLLHTVMFSLGMQFKCFAKRHWHLWYAGIYRSTLPQHGNCCNRGSKQIFYFNLWYFYGYFILSIDICKQILQ